MEFKDILKKLRLEKGLTQNDLSKITGLTRSAIGMYELGKREPSFEVLEQLADFFNVDMNTLLGKKEHENTEFTARDERDIKKHLDKALENLENDEALMFDGEPVEMDTETKELLKASLENSIRLAKTLAKKKYTPKKYQKNDKSDD